MPAVVIVCRPISRVELQIHALDGELVKAVVDCERCVMAIGGELHADEEQVLLEEGSKQENLWGVNLYHADRTETWIEFDSMINLRPSQGNRTRGVDNPEIQQKIRTIVTSLMSDA